MHKELTVTKITHEGFGTNTVAVKATLRDVCEIATKEAVLVNWDIITTPIVKLPQFQLRIAAPGSVKVGDTITIDNFTK